MIRFSNHPDSITNIQIYDSIEQFNGAPLGCIKDYAYENLYKEKFPESDITYKENNFDLLYALLMEEIEGFLTDENICKRFENKFPERITYYDMDIKDEYGFAFYKKDNNALLQEFNEFLAKQDLDALYKKWDVEDTSNVKVEKEVGNGDKLNVGIFFDTKPFCFIENEEQKGYELELLYKFAKEKNYQLNIINLEQVADRINYITNEKANITCGLITITEDRKNSVSFSNPIHETNTCLSVRTDGKKDKVNLTLYNNEYENIDDNKATIYLTISNKEVTSYCAFPDKYNDIIVMNCTINNLNGTDPYTQGIQFINTTDKLRIICYDYEIDNLLKANSKLGKTIIQESDKTGSICSYSSINNNTNNTNINNNTNSSTNNTNSSTNNNNNDSDNNNNDGNTNNNDENNNKKFNTKKSKGLSTGGIIAIIIPCCVALVAALAFAILKRNNSPAPPTIINESEIRFPIQNYGVKTQIANPQININPVVNP